MFVAAALFASAASLPAFAMPLGDQPAAPANQSIIEVAVHCGPHAHYVRGHRNKAGHYVRGRCVRDHH
ncbi:MAG TPA: hypothetical protein VL993_15240 [Stellaceae bacterium]|nr:hypothetical protein [Stellaceae bacterium]